MHLFHSKTIGRCSEGNFTAEIFAALTAKENAEIRTQSLQKQGGFKLNDYFNLIDAKQVAFYRVPKALFTEKKYRKLSTDSKMLYGLLLDRMSLSVKNNWIDSQGRVYQFFTVQQAQKLLNFGHEKICRLFAELSAADLIERKRQGQGKASIIYLKKFL